METPASKPKKKALAFIIAALIALAAIAIIIVITSAKNAPYRELKAALDDGTFSSSWRTSDNKRLVISSDKKAIQIVADKIGEYHEKNDVENALKLLNDLLELGIEVDGSYVYASSSFIDWVKEAVLSKGEGYIETKTASYSWASDDEIYHYSYNGFQLRWDPTMMMNQFYIYVPFLEKECIVMVNNTFDKIDSTKKVEIR